MEAEEEAKAAHRGVHSSVWISCGFLLAHEYRIQQLVNALITSGSIVYSFSKKTRANKSKVITLQHCYS